MLYYLYFLIVSPFQAGPGAAPALADPTPHNIPLANNGFALRFTHDAKNALANGFVGVSNRCLCHLIEHAWLILDMLQFLDQLLLHPFLGPRTNPMDQLEQ
jgi:hypothetical protein